MSAQLLDTSSRHAWSLTGLADSAWNGMLETAIWATKGPAGRVAESVVLGLMQNITSGHLRVSTPSKTYDFPDSGSRKDDGEPSAEIRVKSDTLWIRLCLMGDLGFAEAYMYGEVECDDLVSLFKVFLMNKSQLERLDSSMSFLFALPQKVASYRFLNTLSNSRSNISAHYDISNDMFAGFLSEDMTYSCAIFPELDEDLRLRSPRRGNIASHSRKVTSSSSSQRRRCRSGTPGSEKSFVVDSGVELSNTPREKTGTSDGRRSSAGHKDTDNTDEGESRESSKVNDLLIAAQLKLSTGPSAQDHDFQKVPGDDDREAEETDELCAAQISKLDHIVDKLKIPGDTPTRVLEIGSGWGSMSIRIAERYPLATIDTLTLSVQQQELAQQRIAKRGEDVERRIEVHLMDYRAMPEEWKGAFDKVVSVEMIEAVGREFLEVYWRTLEWAMKGEKAVGVVQVITLPEARFEKYVSEIDFIRKWVIFPGGFLPTLTLLTQSLATGSRGRLVVDSVSNIGPHYARTLREWRQRFLEQFDTVIRPALMREYPKVMGLQRPDGDMEKAREEVEVFKRKWIYYYCYCEVGFTTRTLGDHVITFVREGYEDYGCDVYE